VATRVVASPTDATATRVLRPPSADVSDDAFVSGSVAPSHDPRRPLRGRIVLVVGADDPATRRTALHLAARGASLIVAGRDRDEVLATAGLGAASGATIRVIEAPSPPLDGHALIDLATQVLAAPTDVLVAAAIGPVAASVAEALGVRALACVVPSRPPGGERVFAAATCATFEAAIEGAGSATLGEP
jgi:NAD(P)-dependent dehydrogenase (short-subunit alcohol dehydrogenase family)